MGTRDAEAVIAAIVGNNGTSIIWSDLIKVDDNWFTFSVKVILEWCIATTKVEISAKTLNNLKYNLLQIINYEKVKLEFNVEYGFFSLELNTEKAGQVIVTGYMGHDGEQWTELNYNFTSSIPEINNFYIGLLKNFDIK